MMQRAIFVTLFVLCAGVPAFGADLQFSANGEVEYDDNVFRRESGEEDDVLFRLRPGVRVFEDRGDDLNFSLGYELPVEFAVENNDELNDVDHLFNGRFGYHVSDRVEIFGNDRFGYLRSTLRHRAAESDELSAQGIPEFTEERDRVKINDAALGALYRFSPRLVSRVVGSTTFFDSTREDRARVYSVGGIADATYTLTVKHQVGAGGGYTYQDFSDRVDIPGSQTNIYRVFGTWRWLIDETLNLDVQAGPSYLETTQDDVSAVRSASAIPFSVLPAAFVTGFFDENGNALAPNTPVAAGSLVIPSFLALPGPSLNCASVNGVPVASGCNPNIVLDAVQDAALVNSITGNSVVVTHLDPRGERDHNVNFFADVVLTKRWFPTLSSALRYTRQQSDASGLGGTVILDAVSLANTWDFRDRWQLAVRGDWTQRESAFDTQQTYDQVGGQAIPGGPNPNLLVATRNGTAFSSTANAGIDTQRWGVAARITHRLFRSTSLYVQVRYDEQESQSRTLGNQSDFENILATFGVRHTFEPIKLW